VFFSILLANTWKGLGPLADRIVPILWVKGAKIDSISRANQSQLSAADETTYDGLGAVALSALFV